MSYLVLARKWRPQKFEDVCSQEHVTVTLSNAIKNNRVGHAYLFTGARGVGKTSVARIFARTLRCENATKPCGSCSPCQESLKESSLDILEIDGASNTGVDAIRELRETVSYQPTSGKFKIYIIDEVHMLSTSAFNALLKTLEEPPAHIIFIFATTEPHKIPYTILSRCQRFDFRRITPSDMALHLEAICKKEQIKINQKSILTLCKVADGSLRDALSILDQIIACHGQEVSEENVSETLGLVSYALIYSLAQALIEKNLSQCFSIINQAYHYGHDLFHFATELLEYIRSLLLVKLAPNQDKLGLNSLTAEEKIQLQKQAEALTQEEIIQMYQILLNEIDNISKTSFPKFALELLAAKMTTVFPVIPIQKLLEKMPQLIEKEFSKNNFLYILKQKKPLLSALLEDCKWNIEGDRLTLQVNTQSVSRDEVVSQQTKNTLIDIAQEYFRKEINIHIQLDQEKREVLHPEEELKKQALEDALVQKAQNIFKGTLQAVKVRE